MARDLTRCYVDESVHAEAGFVATSFVFGSSSLEDAVARVLEQAGRTPREDELKSSARMDADPRMRAARDAALGLARSSTRIAIFVGPYDRSTIGKHCLQALQSVLLRNGLASTPLDVYFDEDIFASASEAKRLQPLFRALKNARIYPRENSRLVLGIQVADVVAHSFGQIIKAELSGEAKEVEIGGPDTGYPDRTKAPFGWSLLMNLRYALLTRPMAHEGDDYALETDPVVLDPVHDDPARYGQHPILLGWGVQVAPESEAELRSAVERSLGRLWLGCIH